MNNLFNLGFGFLDVIAFVFNFLMDIVTLVVIFVFVFYMTKCTIWFIGQMWEMIDSDSYSKFNKYVLKKRSKDDITDSEQEENNKEQ